MKNKKNNTNPYYMFFIPHCTFLKLCFIFVEISHMLFNAAEPVISPINHSITYRSKKYQYLIDNKENNEIEKQL